MILAITGGTGFVGGHVIDRAIAAGHRVRALTRRPQPERPAVAWIDGSLGDAPSLDRLVASADAVIHIAGVVNAPDRAGFAEGNIDGTRAIVAAATENAHIARFVHVSSLAAREPGLSNYGWSKAEAEHPVAASTLAWDMVRPPAIYGPGDMEMLDLFRLARSGFALLPPKGRLSVIEVGDLSRLLLALADEPATRQIYEPDDGAPSGWSHRDFARMIGTAVGRTVTPIALPRPILSLGARIDRLARGKRARLTPRSRRVFLPPRLGRRARAPPATRAVASPRSPLPTVSPQPRHGIAPTACYRPHRRRICLPGRRGP